MKLQEDDRVYIKTASGGRIAMNNLRPGDWLRSRWESDSVVLQNSAVLRRTEILCPSGLSGSLAHAALENDIYLGRGKKRWWYDRLPRWLRTHFMPYSKPE